MASQGKLAPSTAVRRSWLLVPLSDEDMIEQAWSFGADVTVLDMTELVAERDKPHARSRARDAISAVSRGGALVFVQIEAKLLHADLMACVWPGLNGIIISRIETPQEMAEADGLISRLEGQRGLLPGTVQVVASIETGKGNYGAMEIARSSPRLWGLTLGRADLVMDLRPEPSGEIYLIPYLMQRIITIANASGLVPIGAWWQAPARGLLAGPEDTYQAALRGRRIGFKGSMCIRPNQVEPLNRGFTPEALEVDTAQRLVDAFSHHRESEANIVHVDGKIAELSSLKQAESLVANAKACSSRDEEKTTAVALASEDA